MAVTWEEADQTLVDLATRLIREHHEHLLDAKIGFMYRSEAAKSGNKKVLGKARKVSEEQRVFIDFDFVIWIARKEFDGFGDEQKAALVDHELCHCGGTYDNWTMKKHDVDEFLSIIVRHGLWLPDLAFAAKAFENAGKGQQALFYPEQRGSVESVPKVEIKRFMANDQPLIERAREDPEGVKQDLMVAAAIIKADNGGKITISDLQRKLRIGYTKAAKIRDLLEQYQEEAK